MAVERGYLGLNLASRISMQYRQLQEDIAAAIENLVSPHAAIHTEAKETDIHKSKVADAINPLVLRMLNVSTARRVKVITVFSTFMRATKRTLVDLDSRWGDISTPMISDAAPTLRRIVQALMTLLKRLPKHNEDAGEIRDRTDRQQALDDLMSLCTVDKNLRRRTKPSQKR